MAKKVYPVFVNKELKKELELFKINNDFKSLNKVITEIWEFYKKVKELE